MLSEAKIPSLTPCQAMGIFLQLRETKLDYCLASLLQKIEKGVLDHLSLEERVDLEKTYWKLCKEEGAECK